MPENTNIDLQIEVATENGDYSVSTNDTLANVLFKMGLDVTTRRLFPSNIKGAPSRYFIRANNSGDMAHRAKSDLLILLVSELADEAIDNTVTGGKIFYDPDTTIGKNIKNALESSDYDSIYAKADLSYYALPLKRLASENFSGVRIKKIMRNVIYVGVLSQVLGIPKAILKKVFQKNFSDKGKQIVTNNLKALKIGRMYAKDELPEGKSYCLREASYKRNRFFMRGNDATALGAVMGGCTYASWYPITPATSHGESLERYAPRYPLIVEQGENEDSCLGRALGAAWAGARASVSTSGPGLSNMAEFIGFSSFAEIPVVIFNIQRAGPATGLPTHTKQGDLLSLLHISHDESPRIILTPSTIDQLYEYSWRAFNIAARYQMPVVILSDLELGLSYYTEDELKYPNLPVDQGKVLSPEEIAGLENYARYDDVDGDGICYRSLPGCGPTYVTRGAYHDRQAKLSETPADCSEKIDRLFTKLETAADSNDLPAPSIEEPPGAGPGFVAFGSSIFSVREARKRLADRGIETALFDLSAISPLPGDSLKSFLDSYSPVFIVEQNKTGQLMSIIRQEIGHADCLRPLRLYDGSYLTADFILENFFEVFTE